MDVDGALEVLRERNRQGGVHPRAMAAFEQLYRSYRSGVTGRVPWAEIAPVGGDGIIPLERCTMPETMAAGQKRLGEVAWIVLNGGLGTSMKMARAKSLVLVKENRSFLDLIAEHVIALRRRYGVQIPLLFMNSFATREDTLRALSQHDLQVIDGAGTALPLDFMQHRFPRIREADGLPLGEASDRDAWSPPGHGNIYLALQCSGVLEALLGRGVRWAFVSNADNLGASVHPGILEYLEGAGIEFAMEVTTKTVADVKGGTLVRRGGRLQLLEIAQVEEKYMGAFQDVGTFPVFNTNNLWVNLRALERRLKKGPMELPLLVNRKQVDGVGVVQLETAMGVLAPRGRFAPVKTTNDLLVRRSDTYLRGEESPLVVNPDRDPVLGPPVVVLDPRYYGSVEGMDQRVPQAPSLVRARSLRVDGDVHFGPGVQVVGDVHLRNDGDRPRHIMAGTVLSG